MTALQAFEGVAGKRYVELPGRFREICWLLEGCLADYFRQPERRHELRQHMVKLAYEGLVIYEDVPIWEPPVEDYTI